ncbi:hypothetical protein [Microbispora amethystogenes]|uniref:Uncharacterized protein n=1 Tax=Microbispora amethystogenes TaxID=1427754 RepID=A0ABQ4FFK7_9ACTN|nr:hypothetical protein [Microbispora amethystogenes]GIH33583.1 hypothetical protein Mam01_37470 [Microbispora amethystogenes]
MARHTARNALIDSAARLLALGALAVTSAGVALSPGSAAAAGRGWGGGGGDANASGTRWVINNGLNNRAYLLTGSQRNAFGVQQVVAGVDAAVNTQAANCRHRPGCGVPQHIWGSNTSFPTTRGNVTLGGH